ncbi:MAG TPA: hypothetical protein VKB89_14605, partial [Xanthobacteraceae bacterium]|nr:hypothetical protein [Xanthobacteraceae bacterium]
MTTHDFNDAETQRNFDVIPDGTVATVRMTIRPGSAGEGGWLRRSKDGNSEALDCEFVVFDGPFAKRKFWTLFTIAGITPGHAEAANISAGKLRAILESARGIKPDDKSDTAKQAVEPPQNGYKAKNRLDHVVTPDEKAWKQVTQEPAATPSAAPAKPAFIP